MLLKTPLCSLIFLSSLFFPLPSNAGRILTNEIRMDQAPQWLEERQVQRVVRKIQRALEWDIRRINVTWYWNQQKFENVHRLGKSVLAFARKSDSTVHLGPAVNRHNFDSVFGHELVHVILGQKYKDAIPKWLEEGLANHAAGRGSVNYRRLARQSLPEDVRSLSHPFGKTTSTAELHYEISQALVEFIASKCRLRDLLQLSVGKGLERYLSTYCEIRDLNLEFRGWVRKKGSSL